MVFKPKRSRCIMIRKLKVTDAFKAKRKTSQQTRRSPSNAWGSGMMTALAIRTTSPALKNRQMSGQGRLTNQGCLGKLKSWIYQHGLLPGLMWLLTVYEVQATMV